MSSKRVLAKGKANWMVMSEIAYRMIEEMRMKDTDPRPQIVKDILKKIGYEPKWEKFKEQAAQDPIDLNPPTASVISITSVTGVFPSVTRGAGTASSRSYSPLFHIGSSKKYNVKHRP